MQATLNICHNPFHPALDREQKPIYRKCKIQTLVKQSKIDLAKPVICLHNGAPLLRQDWQDTTINDGDVIAFVYLPQGGGGGSNPIRLALTIALAVYAPALATSLTSATAGFAFTAAKIGIGLLGTALINALVPPTQLPKARQQQQLAAASPTYSLSAQGNQARIGEAIPVLYGKLRLFPDFAAQPYVEYENNEQYLYQLFCITQGQCSFDVAEVWLEDTPISGFTGDYTLEKVEPFAASTLYPTEVYNVNEVTGQELIDVQLGYFNANPTTTRVTQLAFDVVLPRGLNYLNDGGGYDSRSLSFTFYARAINDAGAVTGSVITLGSETISGATATAIRRTYKYTVPNGRYQVAVMRNQAKSNDQRFANDAVWSGARAYSSASRTYGNVTLLALKLKATNTVSSQSSRKLNLLATRRLSAPSMGVGGVVTFASPANTQSIAWAIADMCRAEYGAGVDVTRYNVGQLIALNTLWQSRGDTFNAIYDSTSTFWEALTLACRAGRVRPFIQGGIIHFVRDSLQTMPTVLFSNRNIVKDTFKLSYVMPSDDNADAVDVEYLDETIWKPRVIRASLDAGSVTKPVKVQAFGITNRDHAFREGMYMAAANRYRRKEISFETELEGHIPSLGDLIAIQHDMPEWGQYGEAVAATANSITSSEPFEWQANTKHFALLRTATGGAIGPIEVTRGANDAVIVFSATQVTAPIFTGFDQEKTHIVFGPAGRVVQLARVLSIKPRDKSVAISAINEDARVHGADGTSVPLDLFNWSLPAPSIRPVLADFTLTQSGSGLTPNLSLSWQPPTGAVRFIIETSTDSDNWSTIAEITQNTYNFFASSLGLLYVRVAAFGGLKGPYVTKSINVGQVAPPPNVESGSITPAGQAFGVKWAEVADCDAYKVQVVIAASVVREFTLTTNAFDYTLENALADGGPWRTIGVRVWALKGGVQSLNALVLSGTNQAPAAPSVTLVPGMGNIGITVSVSTEADCVGTVIHASDSPNFRPSGANQIYDGAANFYLLNTTTAKYIRAAHYDAYGKAYLNYSNEFTTTPQSATPLPTTPINPTAQTNYFGDVVYSLADKSLYEWSGTVYNRAAPSVAATQILAANLSAISANLGSVTAGSLTIDNDGFIRGGQTAYNNGTGFWAGYHINTYKLSLTGATGKYFRFDGVDIEFNGRFIGDVNITGGQLNVNNQFIVTETGHMTALSGSYGGTLLAGVLDFSQLDGLRQNYTIPGTYNFIVPAEKNKLRITVCGGSGDGGVGGIAGQILGGAGGGGGVNPLVITVDVPVGAQIQINVGGRNTQSSVTIPGLAPIVCLGGGAGGNSNGQSGGAGGAGVNGAQSGQRGSDVYYEAIQVLGATVFMPRSGSGGGGGPGVLRGGNGGGGNDNNISRTLGQNGYVMLEAFNPNAVVLQTTYNTLVSALQRQGIQTT